MRRIALVCLPFIVMACVGDDNIGPGGDAGKDVATTTDSTTDSPASASFELTATPSPVVAKRGGTTQLTVKATRTNGFAGAIDIALSNLPAGVTATPTTMLGTDSQVLVTLTCDANAAAATQTATVTGTSGSTSSTTNAIIQVPGAPGAVDTAYGTAGTSITTGQSTGFYTSSQKLGAVLQPDGKLLVAVTIATSPTTTAQQVLRFTTTGALDTTFGTGGMTDYTQLSGEAAAVAIQADGKPVIAGTVINGSQSMSAARYTTAGVLDTTFNTTGISTHNHGSVDSAVALVMLSDGRIVVGGWDDAPEFVATAFKTDGTVDTAYSNAATVSIGTGCYAYAIGLQAFDQVVIGGGAGSAAAQVFAAIESNGTPAISFGGKAGGFQETGAATSPAEALVVLQNDHFRAVAGTATSVRIDGFDNNGNVDTFGTAGKLSVSVSGGQDSPQAIVTDANGNLVVVGTTPSATAFAVRALADGSNVDSTFTKSTNVFGTSSGASNGLAAVVDSNGGLLVVGFGNINVTTHVGKLYITRLWL